MTPKFTVIIPVHNKLPHLERSINSVLNQTLQDFEIILIDDASTDGSSENIREFEDTRIRIFTRTEPGPGGYAARNLGIEKANGEWIAFLDADDEWYPHHLESMNKLALKYPDVYFMSCGWETQKGEIKNENPFYINFKDFDTLRITVEEYLLNALLKRLPLCTIVACVKRSSPIALNLFPADSGAKRGGDLHAWLKMICYHREMAWSYHIGAIYHLESVNMVTKKASFSIVNLSKESYTTLSQGLNKIESVFLKKYINFRIKNDLKASKIQGVKMLNVLKNIHFRDDLINALLILLIWVAPVKQLSKLKKSIKF